jgi:hypothetical protein
MCTSTSNGWSQEYFHKRTRKSLRHKCYTINLSLGILNHLNPPNATLKILTKKIWAHVLPRGSRPRMAATQRARAMLVKGWAHRLAFCCATPSLHSTPWHWQPAVPPNAWRGHFNAAAWACAPASNVINIFLRRPRRRVEHTDAPFSLLPHRCYPHHRREALATPWPKALGRGKGG